MKPRGPPSIEIGVVALLVLAGWAVLGSTGIAPSRAFAPATSNPPLPRVIGAGSQSHGVDAIPNPQTCSNCVIKRIGGCERDRGIAFDPARNELFVAGEGCNSWYVISGASNSLVGGGAAWNAPVGVAYDPISRQVFISDAEYSVITVVNASNNSDVIRDFSGQGGWLEAAAFDPVDGNVYITSSGGNNIEVLNGSNYTNTSALNVGGGQYGLAVAADTGNLYVAEQSQVTVVSPSNGSFVGNISGPGGGGWNNNAVSSVVYDPLNRQVYVSDPSTGQVSALSTSGLSILANLTVGNQPAGMAYDGGNGLLYVANYGSGNLSVIDPSTDSVVGSIAVGAGIDGIAYDSTNGYLYVTNASSNPSVSVVAPLNSSPYISGISISPNPAQLEPIQMNVSVLAGSAPFTYIYSNLPPGCISANTSALGCTPTRPGTYEVGVTVRDPAGRTANSSVNLVVRPFALSVQLASSEVKLRGPLDINSTVEGDTSPITFAYSGLPPGCSSANVSQFTCRPTGTGAYVITVGATDMNGNNQSVVESIYVSTGPSVLVNATRTAVDANQSVTLVATANGGASPYSFAWHVSNASANCTVSTNGVLMTCVPLVVPSGSIFSVNLTVTDSYGNQINSTPVSITVFPALRLMLSAFPSAPLLGETMGFLANVSGGGSPYSFTYGGFPPGCVSVDLSKVGCLPTQSGWYNVTATVTDAEENSVSRTVSFEVTFDFLVIAPLNLTIGQVLVVSVDTNASSIFNGLAATSGPHQLEGFGSLSYRYSGLPPGCVSQDVATLRCTPSEVGEYNITVYVADQLGDNNTHSIRVLIQQNASNNALPKSPPGSGSSYSTSVPLVLAASVLLAVSTTAPIYWVYRRRKPPVGG